MIWPGGAMNANDDALKRPMRRESRQPGGVMKRNTRMSLVAVFSGIVACMLAYSAWVFLRTPPFVPFDAWGVPRVHSALAVQDQRERGGVTPRDTVTLASGNLSSNFR